MLKETDALYFESYWKTNTAHFRYKFMTREVFVFAWFYNDIKKLMLQRTAETFVKEGKKTSFSFYIFPNSTLP